LLKVIAVCNDRMSGVPPFDIQIGEVFFDGGFHYC
jgi:hypothetical protein